MSKYQFDWSDSYSKGIVHITIKDEIPVGSGNIIAFTMPIDIKSIEKELEKVFQKAKSKGKN